MDAMATQSFALTLWMWAELRVMAREEAVARLGDRTDLAGQIAIAFHQPQDLQKMEMRYLRAAGQLSKMFEDTRAKLSNLATRAANIQPVTEA